MPTFTSPVVLNDGVADNTYTLQATVAEGKSVVTTYKELAHAASAAKTLKTKYNTSSPTINRGVTQINESLAIADGSLKPATFNLSYVGHKQHSLAELEKLGKELIAAAGKAGFWSAFLNQI